VGGFGFSEEKFRQIKKKVFKLSQDKNSPKAQLALRG
jgi:hypothetical protein